MSIAEVVKWEAMNDNLVWKFPNKELATWSQLIVNESQEALFVKEGKLENVFQAGRHTLSTENYPFLKDLFSIPFGGKSPFTAEIWFVNKTSVLDIKWGTANPIEVQDPRYGILVPLTAYGQFGVKIKDSTLFYRSLVGSNSSFGVEKLKSVLKGAIYSFAQNSIASAVIKVGKSPFELNSYLIEIGNIVKAEIQPDAEKIGVSIETFYISGIALPENNSEVKKLKAALAKKAEMDIIGYTYNDEQSFETMKTAMNKGSGVAHGILETGMELGVGMKMAKEFGGKINSILEPMGDSESNKHKCISCNEMIEKNSKFCKYCGSMQEIICASCGKSYKTSVKFCPECGFKIEETVEIKEASQNENV